MSIILGIDPWTTTVWFAIIEVKWNNKTIIECGIIETKPKEELKYKLIDIARDLEWIINKYKPNIASVEKLYFLKNVKTWIDVAHARWVIIHELAKKWISIIEYTPLQVKQWICGNGKANKTQVQNAIKILFWLKEIPKPDDAADALAIAYLASLQKDKILSWKNI